MRATPLRIAIGLATLLLLPSCSFDRASFPVDDTDGGPPPADAAPTIDADPCAAEEIAADVAITCARRSDGLVWCWGDNSLGQIAAPPTALSTNGTPCNPFPTVSSPLPAVAALGMGATHACAITSAAAVWCWGDNQNGQFGDGTSGFFTSSPTEIEERTPAVQVAGGEKHLCHRDLSGQVFCSGGNDFGQLGVGSRTARTIPAKVPGLDPVTAIASGYRHMCAVRASDGKVFCWGANADGQVGWAEGGGDALNPLVVSNVDDVVQITAGLAHSCALSSSGGASCWGRNNEAQLGDGTVEFSSIPVTVGLTPPIDAISAGGNRTCAIKQGSVYCWGDSVSSLGAPDALPTLIPLPAPATMITSGALHNCALLADHTVWCWGWNAYGQLGDGTVGAMISNVPVQALLCR